MVDYKIEYGGITYELPTKTNIAVGLKFYTHKEEGLNAMLPISVPTTGIATPTLSIQCDLYFDPNQVIENEQTGVITLARKLDMDFVWWLYSNYSKPFKIYTGYTSINNPITNSIANRNYFIGKITSISLLPRLSSRTAVSGDCANLIITFDLSGD